MAELDNIECLMAARELLRSSLEKSREIDSAIEQSNPRLERIRQGLPSLEAAIKTIAQKCSVYGIGEHIDHAAGPAAAVLKVFDTVRVLEESLLSDSPSNLPHYLSVVKQLEEALKFLTDNCRLVIQWLEDVLQLLQDQKVDDDRYLLNVTKSLAILGELEAIEGTSHLSGGPLCAAFDKLETEFRHLLMENSASSLPIASQSISASLGEQTCISPPSLPQDIVQKLQVIIDKSPTNDRLNMFVSTYVNIRSLNARVALQSLDLDYLEISLSEFDSVQSIEGHIDQWGKNLEFAVKQLFEFEYRLCKNVFEKLGSDVWMGCFAKIANQSGLHDFIRFGNTITKGKKDAIKLLKLLQVFEALNKLRSHFNRLFGGKACIEIKTQTRDLIKKVVDGACEIFWELPVQVELQRRSTPPMDGSVPKLVSFVSDYCNRLLDDDCLPILAQVLEIRGSWVHERFENELITEQLRGTITAVELNLEAWAKKYEDATLSYLFMMNSHWYLYKNLKGTQLGDLMGDSWLREQEQCMEYYAALYLRESWGKLPAILNEEGLILFPGGRAIARGEVKKRLQAFTEGFDDLYRKQSKWVVSDRSLRRKSCELVVEMVVPVYRNFLQTYVPWEEQEPSPSNSLKYSAESLENMLNSLLQPKLGKHGSTKCTNLIDKHKAAVINHFPSTPAAA